MTCKIIFQLLTTKNSYTGSLAQSVGSVTFHSVNLSVLLKAIFEEMSVQKFRIHSLPRQLPRIHFYNARYCINSKLLVQLMSWRLLNTHESVYDVENIF